MSEEHVGSLMEQYIDLLTDVPHLMFEITSELTVSLLFLPLAIWIWEKIWGGKRIAKHDKKYHPNEIHN